MLLFHLVAFCCIVTNRSEACCFFCNRSKMKTSPLCHQPLQSLCSSHVLPDMQEPRLHKKFRTCLKERVRGERSSSRLRNIPPQRMKPSHSPPDPSPRSPDPLLGAAQDEEGLDTVLFEVGVALAPTARLHFVVAIQVVECGLGDVDASTGRGGSRERGAADMNSGPLLPCRTKLQPTQSSFKSQGPKLWLKC